VELKEHHEAGLGVGMQHHQMYLWYCGRSYSVMMMNALEDAYDKLLPRRKHGIMNMKRRMNINWTVAGDINTKKFKYKHSESNLLGGTTGSKYWNSSSTWPLLKGLIRTLRLAIGGI